MTSEWNRRGSTASVGNEVCKKDDMDPEVGLLIMHKSNWKILWKKYGDGLWCMNGVGCVRLCEVVCGPTWTGAVERPQA